MKGNSINHFSYWHLNALLLQLFWNVLEELSQAFYPTPPRPLFRAWQHNCHLSSCFFCCKVSFCLSGDVTAFELLAGSGDPEFTSLSSSFVFRWSQNGVWTPHSLEVQICTLNVPEGSAVPWSSGTTLLKFRGRLRGAPGAGGPSCLRMHDILIHPASMRCSLPPQEGAMDDDSHKDRVNLKVTEFDCSHYIYGAGTSRDCLPLWPSPWNRIIQKARQSYGLAVIYFSIIHYFLLLAQTLKNFSLQGEVDWGLL